MKNQAYDVNAGSCPNASVPHYSANDQPLAGRQLVCLDAGAEVACYASDVTRTFPISGYFTPEARAIYSVVERMQGECIARARPGIPYRSLHLHAASVAVVELLRLGILRGASARDIFTAGTVAAFFPHGLGHHIGLEVHDVSPTPLMADAGPSPGAVGVGKRHLVSPRAHAQLLRDAFGQGQVEMANNLAPGMVVTIEPGM